MFKIAAVFAMTVVACHAFGDLPFSFHEITGPHTNVRGNFAACSPGYSVCRMDAKWQGPQGGGDDTGMDGTTMASRMHAPTIASATHPVIRLTLMMTRLL